MALAGLGSYASLQQGPIQRLIQRSVPLCALRCQRTSPRSFTTKTRTGPRFGFAFDIDGVLLRSAQPLPGARTALATLRAHRIPFVLLTNGGGRHEAERAANVSRALNSDKTISAQNSVTDSAIPQDRLANPSLLKHNSVTSQARSSTHNQENLAQPIDIDPRLLIQSHTPFAAMLDESIAAGRPALKDECVLVLGGEGDRCARVAESYGFRNVVTSSDIYTAYPHLWPFSKPFAAYHAAHARPLPLPLATPSTPAAQLASTSRIAAAFIYNDPRDWGLDVQLLLDLALSEQGHLGRYSSKDNTPSLPNRGYGQDGQPPMYFSNPDLVFAAEWPLPRLGAGGFRAAFEGVWHAATNGAELCNVHVGGKPHAGAYRFAEDRLLLRATELADGASSEAATDVLDRVYMIGDNPASDILGAKSFKSPRGIDWKAILVESGVYAGAELPEDIPHPDTVVGGVWDAVQWACRQEGFLL